MDGPKLVTDDCLDFLVAAPRAYTLQRRVRGQADHSEPPAHDTFTRLLTRLEPNPKASGQRPEIRPIEYKYECLYGEDKLWHVCC